MKKICKLLQSITVLCACLYSVSALAWWDEKWPYRTAVNIDASATGANLSESNKEVTVLLKLHSGNFADFFNIKENLADVRFIADDDKTPLKYHVESADLINQLIYIWVKLPVLSGGISTEKVWMYYGNEEAVTAEDRAGSFDSETVLAYQFSNAGAAPVDATAYATPTSGFTGTMSKTSLIAGGANFALGNRLTVNETPAMAITPEKGLTVSFWFKPLAASAESILFERTNGTAGIQLVVNGANIFSRFNDGKGKVIETTPVGGVRADTWQHVALVLSADRMTIYLDGNPAAFSNIVLAPISGNWSFAGAQGGGKDFSGDMDQLIIATTARNASWLKAEAINQGPTNTLIVPQAAEQLGNSAADTSLMMVLLKSNDEAGWVIMFLMFFMALGSWMVMVGKFIYIRRVRNDNQRFLADYDKIKFKNPALLDHDDADQEETDDEYKDSPILQAIFSKHDHYQSSPIYRLYHRGIQEVHPRVAASVKSAKPGLNSEAVYAIKASIDAQIVREVQRLNSKVVLLSISISGGPYLGLLGTVIGVMLTFAAIAKTGDVNISAIAPGVAAALLCTVGGLIVAIPALFGYNYLATQIKENVADMKVFADEYVTRLAEYYRDVAVVRDNGKHKASA